MIFSRKAIKKTYVLFIIFILFISTSCTDDNENELNNTKNDTNIESGDTDNNEDDTKNNPENDNKIFAGMYKVGTEIPAGEYKLFANDDAIFGAYFELTKDSTGELDSIISNNTFTTFTYLTVKDGEYLSLQDCYALPASDVETYTPADGIYADGMYLVGYDIPAGEYKISLSEDSVIGMGYVEVSSNSRHDFNSIISNNNVDTTIYQTISDGQYLTLQDVYINIE